MLLVASSATDQAPGVYRASRFLIDTLAALPGVSAAEGRVVGEALIDLPGLEFLVRGRVFSLPDMDGAYLNGVRLVTGRLPDPGNTELRDRKSVV